MSGFCLRGSPASKGELTLPVFAASFALRVVAPYAHCGLATSQIALATTIGAWINFALVLWFGARAGFVRRDPQLARAMAKLAAAGLALALVLHLGARPALHLFAASGRLRDLLALITLAAVGGVVYVGIVLALFGRQWLAQLRRRRAAAGPPPPLPEAPLE